VDLRRENDVEQLRRIALAQQVQIEQLLRVLSAKCEELQALKGSPEEQAREVSGVFLAALAQDDLETAYGLLCAEERARLAPGAVPAEYAPGGTGEVTGATADEVGGAPVQRVEVAWSDGSTSTLTVVSEQGARVCGTATG